MTDDAAHVRDVIFLAIGFVVALTTAVMPARVAKIITVLNFKPSTQASPMQLKVLRWTAAFVAVGTVLTYLMRRK